MARRGTLKHNQDNEYWNWGAIRTVIYKINKYFHIPFSFLNNNGNRSFKINIYCFVTVKCCSTLSEMYLKQSVSIKLREPKEADGLLNSWALYIWLYQFQCNLIFCLSSKSWNYIETLTGYSKPITDWPEAVCFFSPYCETRNPDWSQSRKALSYSTGILCWRCKAPHLQVGSSKLKRFTQHTIMLELRLPDPAPYADRQYFSTLKVSSKNESSRGWLISPVPHQRGWKWHFWWNTFFLLCQILQIFSLNHAWQLSSPWLSHSQQAQETTIHCIKQSRGNKVSARGSSHPCALRQARWDFFRVSKPKNLLRVFQTQYKHSLWVRWVLIQRRQGNSTHYFLRSKGNTNKNKAVCERASCERGSSILKSFYFPPLPRGSCCAARMLPHPAHQ